jgi:hypothetical protein
MSDPTVWEDVTPPAREFVGTIESLELASTRRAENGVLTAGEIGVAEVRETEPSALASAAAVLPVTPAKRTIDGRYSGTGAGRQLELRVDIDGVRPLMRISGDFFQTTGGTTSYTGSFIVNAPTVETTPTQGTVAGTGTFTMATGAPFIRVTIPRVAAASPPQPATVQFFTSESASVASASYLCAFVSPFFRTVQWEQDSVVDTVPFVSYNTGSLPLPPGTVARELSVPNAFADAGIELQVSSSANVISPAGVGAAWSDSELHNAMVNHFSLFTNAPEWRTWLLVASAHEENDGYRGIMFDTSDAFQRQGCAVFYDAIKGEDPANQRAQLRTYVHELGHAFNLLHSWEKNLADPPQPLGPNNGFGDLSWMNYAWRYQAAPGGPTGEAAYWAAFPFQFTNSELLHLRHGFYKDVVMGGNPFGLGAAEVEPDFFKEAIVDNSGLALELRAEDGLGRPRTFAYGEPVVVELKLSTTDLRGVDTHVYLHPKDNFVTIMIQHPSGRTMVYEPLLKRCADQSRTIRLDSNRPAIYESAYIGFGNGGQYFDQPGQYKIRAQYVASDGSRVISPVLTIRVRMPVTEADVEVGELLLGEEVGKLLYLLGSDAGSLQAGNAAFDLLLDKHGEHPLGVYARMVKGINAERDFKHLTVDKQLQTREARPQESVEHLSSVEKASATDKGVDNVTLNMVMQRLASAEVKAGRPAQATKTMDRMVKLFSAKGLNKFVLETIGEQAAGAKSALAADAK